MRLGVDTGGTFTDFVLLDDAGRLRVHKILSTPDAPEAAILQGVQALGIDPAAIRLVHGSTVATNAVLEGKGVETVYVTNRGFGDLLSIGRQQRAALYDLQPQPEAEPLPAERCVETGGRIGADGVPLEPLTEADLDEVSATVARIRPQAVAINLLFSYLDDAAERRLAAVLPEDVFVSLSSEVLPEVREYERGIATWLNAWVGPRVAGYLRRLQARLPGTPVSVMQSAGNTVAADQAASQAVRMLLSGPAGGLVAAQRIGESSRLPGLMTFDMGGTSTDVALVDGRPQLTSEGRIGRFPVAVPMVDMHTIGAGGGSMAWLDGGGMLQVGPASAGAVPGPACYGRGGVEPTVTDANLLLGRLQSDSFLDGEMALDVAAASAAIGKLARKVGQSPERTARDIVAIANEHMVQALRAIAIRRGADPRDHVLLSFGGAGGMHVCALAEALEMERAIVPMHGGVLSALGMLASRPGRQLSHSYVDLLDAVDLAEIATRFERLSETGLRALREEGFDAKQCDSELSVDLRYRGQSYTLNVPWLDPVASAAAFHRLHIERYGHRMDLAVELVNIRVAVRGPDNPFALPRLALRPPATPARHCTVAGIDAAVPIYRRDALAPGQHLMGPALICEQVATTWLAAGWAVTVDDVGHLLLARAQAD